MHESRGLGDVYKRQATETVVRLLHIFKDEGILQIEGRKLFVTDTDRLKDISRGIVGH
mgnify:CR=1 FL=1